MLVGAATIPARPLLAPWYRVVGDGERLLFEHAQRLVVVEGAAVRELLPSMLPLLDGTRTVDELVTRLGEAVRPAVETALELLSTHRVVVEGPDVPSDGRPAVHAAAAAFGLTPAEAAERLHSASIGVVGSGSVTLETVRLLCAAGVGCVRVLPWRGRGRCDLTIVAPAVDELDRLPSWNRAALGVGGCWLLVRPFDGRCAAVGPLMLPGQTCCYECLLLRRAGNSGYPQELREVESAPLTVYPDAGMDAFTAAIAANVAVRSVVGRDRTLAGAVLTLESHPRLRLEQHAVLRVPRCPACSAADRRAAPLPWHAAAAA